MIWEISFLLASYGVLITAPRVVPYSPGEEYLEQFYNVDIVRSIRDVITLDMTDFVIDDNDVKHLSIECKVNEECLKNKKTSVEKFHQKMQAIQCVNGLYVLNVLDKLKSIMVDIKDSIRCLPLVFDRRPIYEYDFYLTRMLVLLKLAQWDAYAWQIEIFTFLSGLADSEANIELYVEHYENNHVSMREKVLAFVNLCIENNYLLSLNNTATENPAVFQFVVTMYMDPPTDNLLMSPSLFYTVPNLMLQHLYLHDDFIFDWSMVAIKLNTSDVKQQMRTQFGLYYPQDKIDKWRLNPFNGNKYHILISKYIHLKAEYVAWFHLYVFHTLLNRIPDVYEQIFNLKQRLIGCWKILALDLKCILRAVWFDENIYWSAINIMMVDLKTISKEELTAREQYTRNYFCQSVEDLGLSSASDMQRQLEKIEIPNDYISIFRSIQVNIKNTAQFCYELERVSYPYIDKFIRILLGAEGNAPFIMH